MISHSGTCIIIFIYETSRIYLILDCKNSSVTYILRSCVILEKNLLTSLMQRLSSLNQGLIFTCITEIMHVAYYCNQKF